MQRPKTDGAVVYHGIIRPQVVAFVGVDRRILALIALVVLFVVPASRAGFVALLYVAGIAVALFIVGRRLAATSPHFLDEITAYIQWRAIAPTSVLDDDNDAHLAPPKGFDAWKDDGIGRV